MNVTEMIKFHWATYVVATFGDDAFQAGCELPVFEAYVVKGNIKVFTGRISDTKNAQLTKALELFTSSFSLEEAA